MGLYRAVTIEISICTTRNRLVTIDFDRHRPLSGGISLATTREEASREKEEEREGARRRGRIWRTLTRLDPAPPSLDDPVPGGNDEAVARLLLRQ
ncbi:hypothetical protein BHE74_00035220, partial [Ensete ventricosum]